MEQIYCPNCRERFPERLVEYDELLYSIFNSQASSYGLRSRSYSWRSQHGKVSLCAPCATRYKRMVRLRKVGWRIANPSIILLILGALFLAIAISTNPGLRSGIGAYLVTLPIFVAAVGLVVGCSLALAARLMRRTATRFLRKPFSP